MAVGIVSVGMKIGVSVGVGRIISVGCSVAVGEGGEVLVGASVGVAEGTITIVGLGRNVAVGVTVGGSVNTGVIKNTVAVGEEVTVIVSALIQGGVLVGYVTGLPGRRVSTRPAQ